MDQLTAPSNEKIVYTGHAGGVTPLNYWYTVCNLILTIPRFNIDQVEAIASFPGIVVNAAVKHARDVWNNGSGNIFLNAGHHDQEVVDAQFSQEVFATTFCLRDPENVFSQGQTGNAPGQTKWIASQLKERQIQTVAIFVPAFHLPRIFMTLLVDLKKIDHHAVIIPMPTRMSPFERSLLDSRPEVNTHSLCQVDVTPAEADPRMETYSKPEKGNVATLEMLIDYLQVAYKDPILAEGLYSDADLIGLDRKK